MVDATRTRTKEREAGPRLKYDYCYSQREEFAERGKNGVIVIKDSDREWETSRQGYLKFYLVDSQYPGTALTDWWVFVHDIKKQSGKHRHQGGLVLFVLEGKGATECNGEMIEWEEGDCILLPFHPDGIEHRHFNRGTEPAKWLAFIHLPTWNHVAAEMTQLEEMQSFRQDSRT